MKELWQTATNSTVLPATLLLIPVLLYWVVGLFGMTDGDAGGDSDAGGEGDSGDGDSSDGGGGHFISDVTGAMLRLVNASEIPFMVVISLLSIFFWLAMVLGSMLLPFSGGWFDWALTGGALVAALLMTRLAVIPLKPLVRAIRFDKDVQVPVIGRTATVRSHELTTHFGQVEVPDAHGPMFLNARLIDEGLTLRKGDEVIIVSLNSEKMIYSVKSTHNTL